VLDKDPAELAVALLPGRPLSPAAFAARFFPEA